jgi:hypothetical protein
MNGSTEPGTEEGRIAEGPAASTGPGPSEPTIEDAPLVVVVRRCLESDQAAPLVALGYDTDQTILNTVLDIYDGADDSQQERLLVTMKRATNMRFQLSRLLMHNPRLVTAEYWPPARTAPPDATVSILGRLLTHLILNEAGAFSRLGKELGWTWGILPMTLVQLQTLTEGERQAMEPCCRYIEEMAMLTTGLDELLVAQP